jgi:hypothetical protein
MFKSTAYQMNTNIIGHFKFLVAGMNAYTMLGVQVIYTFIKTVLILEEYC